MAEQKEILESIRDIISGAPGEDDVLELTKKLNEDGSVTEIKPAPVQGNDVLKDIDSLLNEKPAAADKNVELEFKAKPEKFEIAEEFSPQDAISPRPENNEIKQKDTPMADNLDTIISGDSAKAATASISELTNRLKGDGREAAKVEPSAPFRNGETVEDLVVEMLKPMMKDWLDKNLPKLVNEIVQKEIQKLIPRE